MGQLTKVDGEWYAGNKHYICPPGSGDGVICPRHGELVPAAHQPLRWRNPIIFVGILTVAGSVIGGALTSGSNLLIAVLTRPPAPMQMDPCRDAASHFLGAQTEPNFITKRELYYDHLTKFPTCKFVDATKIALNNLALSGGSSPVSASPQIGAQTSSPPPAPNELPPIEISPPRASKLARALSPGTRYVYSGIDVYRILPALEATTTYRVIKGSATVVMDGIRQGEVWAGRRFRLFTIGWSQFEIATNEPDTAIEVVAVQSGDRIGRNRYSYLE